MTPISFSGPSSDPRNGKKENDLRTIADTCCDKIKKIDELLELAQRAQAQLDRALELIKKQ